jgi:hypothetical protein
MLLHPLPKAQGSAFKRTFLLPRLRLAAFSHSQDPKATLAVQDFAAIIEQF